MKSSTCGLWYLESFYFA